ncbi:MAG: hypothetical protein RLZ55_448 [Actinomycetota bacterium]|jgi:diaminohydroxyphosphoribosylaminopyrimidine deaminase/5-amino-6-(5-phosphoribosylamino)uracil reductase
MQRAIELAASSGIDRGPNPAVGCVLLGAGGEVLAEGCHRGPGTPHAEAAALAALDASGRDARGATAVVSLEPCAHHGRTPPCADALIAAGVARVVYAQTDPNPVAAGGAARLRTAGLEVAGGLLADEAAVVNRIWSLAARLGRPVVTWKVAASLDGRIAAADGTSQWITSPESREQVHALRASVDAVLTGTGTALADRPQLTARPQGAPALRQPVRAVMGLTEMPDDHPLVDAMLLRTRDPAEALGLLFAADVRHVMLECGPRLANAFLSDDLVDRIVWFAAPILLGSFGLAVVEGGPVTLADADRWLMTSNGVCGPDVRIELLKER